LRSSSKPPTARVRAPEHRQRRQRRITFWLAIAAVVHAEVGLILGVAFFMFAPHDADLQRELAARANEGESIDVGMLDDDTARKIVADLEKQEEERKAEEVKKEVDSVHAPGQVVDMPAPREEKRPDDARFASEHDSTVTHETKRYEKSQGETRQGDVGGDSDVSKPAARRNTNPSEPSERPDKRLAMRTPDLGRALRMPPGMAAPTTRSQQRAGGKYGAPDPSSDAADNEVPQHGEEAQLAPPGGGSSGGGGGPLSLMPSEQQLARAVGAGSQDAIKDVDDGEETALNSKKWRFASFFNRVKRQVAEHWHPEEAYRRRDPTGAVYGRQNRYTELRIQLKPDGRLANVALAQPSGLEFLDDEAIEAFKEAQPFPNPPRQLVEASGVINFRFGFLFDLNGPPQMRWFRYND
jgi:TonB family protein